MITIKSSTTEEVFTSKANVIAVVLVGGTANSSVALNDSASGSGTDKIKLKALANTSESIVFPKDVPVVFDTAIYSTIAGSGAEVYLYLE
jgi:hypothetical protein